MKQRLSRSNRRQFQYFRSSAEPLVERSSRVAPRPKIQRRKSETMRSGIHLLIGVFLLVSLLLYSLKVLDVAENVDCGHTISTIKLSTLIEVHTEMDIECPNPML